MTGNWTLISVLFCFSLPGVCIAIPRIIRFLLPDNPEILQINYSRFAMLLGLFMTFMMSVVGVFLSARTGLNAPLLEGILKGQLGLNAIIPILGPTFAYAFVGLILFFGLYYGVVKSQVDKKSFQIMENMRVALGMDGCVFFGVVEEIIARWGLMNAVVFFALLMTGNPTDIVILLSIFFSGFIFAISQVPTYLAAGCVPNRTVVYSIVFLSLFKSLLFGLLFWKYGLISAILAHMLFHLGWSLRRPHESS